MPKLEGKPEVSVVVAALERILESLDGTECDDNGNPGIDVRLQVVDGSWQVHTGSAQFDTDHRGYWGVGFMAPEDDLLSLASSLLDEVDEEASEDGYTDDDGFPEWEFGDEEGPCHIRTWESEGFKLEMYDSGKKDRRGCTEIAYRLTDRGEVIFQEGGFCGSPMHADDADETVAALLSFLSLKPGDTDEEYFKDYTPRQLEWCKERGEELSMLEHEMEEAANATEFVAAAGFTLCKGESDDGEPVWTDGDRMYRPNAVGWPTDEHGQCLEGEMKR